MITVLVVSLVLVGVAYAAMIALSAGQDDISDTTPPAASVPQTMESAPPGAPYQPPT
jgi:hypothetical protein